MPIDRLPHYIKWRYYRISNGQEEKILESFLCSSKTVKVERMYRGYKCTTLPTLELTTVFVTKIYTLELPSFLNYRYLRSIVLLYEMKYKMYGMVGGVSNVGSRLVLEILKKLN